MKQDNLDKVLACLFALVKHRGIACDDAKWITYHPKGKGANGENKGRKCLIDETAGQIIKGGPPNSAGKNIRQAFKQSLVIHLSAIIYSPIIPRGFNYRKPFYTKA